MLLTKIPVPIYQPTIRRVTHVSHVHHVPVLCSYESLPPTHFQVMC